MAKPRRTPCVLLAGGGLGGVLGVLRSLGPRGVPIYVAAPDKWAACYARSRWCRGTLPLDPSWEARELCERVTESQILARTESKPVLLPMNDRFCTLVNEERTAWEQRFEVVMPRRELVESLVDKARAHRLAVDAGLNVPRSEFVRSHEDLRDAVARMTYPVVVKPTWWRCRGNTTLKADILESASDLVRVGSRYIDGGASLAVQEYIPGGDETVEVFMFYRSRDGVTTLGCTGRKIRQNPPGAGIMASGRAEWLPHVTDVSKRFLERINYRGLGGIEFKQHAGRSYFIEVSVRLEGFHPLAIEAGLDLPWYAYCDHASVWDGWRLGQHHQRTAHWLDERAYLELIGCASRPARMLYEMLRLLLARRARCAVWSTSDPWPMIAHVWAALVNRFKRLAARG